MKLLIVEDELLVQKSLEKFLTLKGLNVTSTSSGIEALNLIRSNHFDKVLCDIMLKDITGFDIIEELKKDCDISKLKEQFFFMTAYSSSNILDRIESYGCGYVKKPFEGLENLYNKLV